MLIASADAFAASAHLLSALRVCVCKSVNFLNYIRTQSWVLSFEFSVLCFERQPASWSCIRWPFVFFFPLFFFIYGRPAMLSLLNANVSWPKTLRLWMSRKCNAAVACPWKCSPIGARTADFWPEITDLASRSQISNLQLDAFSLYEWSVLVSSRVDPSFTRKTYENTIRILNLFLKMG